MNNITKAKVLFIMKKYWLLFLLGGLTFIIFLVTIFLPGEKKSAIGNIPVPTKKPFNPFGFLDGDKKKDNEKKVIVTDDDVSKSLTNIHSGDPAASLPTNIVRILPNGTRSTQSLSQGGVVQTAQGTISTQANINTGVSSNDQVDNIRIIFKNPDGSTTIYIPPGTPPNEVRWGRYTNNRYNYAINYPVNWQFVYSVDGNGNEGVALYPPYVNANDPKSPFIGFGLSDNFLLPAVGGDTSNALVTKVKVDGISGDLYTDGPLGSSYMASTFTYTDKFFGLGASMSDATFAYVYYYMIYSLTFNSQ